MNSAIPQRYQQNPFANHAQLLDLGVALLSGLAGSVATCRAGSGSDAMMTLPGVAIAVTLMPPLCAMGFDNAPSQIVTHPVERTEARL